MNSVSWESLGLIWPELFLALSGMALLVIGVFRGNESTRILSWAAAAVFAVAALFLLGMDWDRTVILNGFFMVDRFGGFMKLLTLLGMTAAAVLSVRYIHQEQMARFEYPVLMIFAGLGMMVMISAHNLLTVYLGLELQSLSLYVLAAIRRDERFKYAGDIDFPAACGACVVSGRFPGLRPEPGCAGGREAGRAL